MLANILLETMTNTYYLTASKKAPSFPMQYDQCLVSEHKQLMQQTQVTNCWSNTIQNIVKTVWL